MAAMAFMAVLESDLRALSAEARRKYPAVKDGAEHAILKLRSLSGPSEIAHNEDILQIFLMACDVKSAKLSVIGLSCLQKLISHDAVLPSALNGILFTLKNHAEMSDETVQLKTLQTILIVFQSHLQPENEENLAKALGICLQLLENSKSSDSVHNTAAATFRQAVALVLDNVVRAESLPFGKTWSGNYVSRTSSVAVDVSRNIEQSVIPESDAFHGSMALSREYLSNVGKLGLRLLEDLTALASGAPAPWLRVNSLQRIFSLDIIEFILSNYVVVFRNVASYEQILRHQICSLLMTSLRINTELEGEAGEPSFRRLVLRSVAHVIRFYSSSLVTECEVFLNMLLKVLSLDLPLWHRILVLEVLRGFCVEARTLRILFQNFDMDPKNTNIVENMVKSLARVVSTIQVLDSCEESLAAVAGMFSSKAKGIEWSMDNDTSNAAVVVASEAHAITLAVEGLLGVVFTVATLTDEAVDLGELESPRFEEHPPKCMGKMAIVCHLLVDSIWLVVLDALSLILSRSQGEAIILEILKGYQAFTQACGILHAVEPLNSFLASLCKFTISIPNETEKKSVLSSPGSKKSEPFSDQKDSIVLTPKNVQALRTLFNIAHRLHNVLGPSWVLVLETLAALDRTIHSPHASTQEVSSVPRLTREMSGQNSDFHILSSLNSQLFESSAMMHISAVKSLLSALRQLTNQCNSGNSTGQQMSSISFSVEKMSSVLGNNLHRATHIWDLIADHLLELADNPNMQLRSMALEALDGSMSSILGSEQFLDMTPPKDQLKNLQMEAVITETKPFECGVVSPLRVLSMSRNLDVRAGSLKILLHILERHGEHLYHSWPEILDLLRSVADASEKDLIPLAFQSVRVVINDGLSTMPVWCLDLCIQVAGAYSAQKSEINISLTAIGLLWTTTDFIAKGLPQRVTKGKDVVRENNDDMVDVSSIIAETALPNVVYHDKLLLSVFYILKQRGADERAEVRNAAIRTLFQIFGSHGQKLSQGMWEDCLWNHVFPILDSVSHLAATSSRDEWQGKELGIRGGKAVHMLIHHSRNTAQKQWDETVVLVLGGITRILRSFFSFLQTLDNFTVGWNALLCFVKDSISAGSKEVALAAINCLQTIISSHCPKGNLSVPYLISVLDVYVSVVQNYPSYSHAGNKVKKEILHGLGDLYVQAKTVFQNDMYSMLVEVVWMAIYQSLTSRDDGQTDSDTVSLVQRTILEILPLLRPAEHLSAMWPDLIQGLLYYLPGYEGQLYNNTDRRHSGYKDQNLENIRNPLSDDSPREQNGTNYSSFIPKGTHGNVKTDMPNSLTVDHDTEILDPTGLSNHLFGEKLVPIIVDIYLDAPAREKCKLSPEIIHDLGRCMITRRDFPKSMLWRVAVDAFNQVLIDGITRSIIDCDMDSITKKAARTHFWKEVADIYEIFLMNCCGRALPSDGPSSELLKADESLEMNILDVLGDKVLMTEIDAPIDSLRRLVSTLDRCASRTGSLPLETVGLLPAHCSRFSLHCLQKIFSSCSYKKNDVWQQTRLEISQISISILMNRCKSILNQFLIDENDLGEHPIPSVRFEEMIFILQELAQMHLHHMTASIIHLRSQLSEKLSGNQNLGDRAHLLFLFPCFCELVVSRDVRIRQLVQALLKLIMTELRLDNVDCNA